MSGLKIFLTFKGHDIRLSTNMYFQVVPLSEEIRASCSKERPGGVYSLLKNE